MYRVDFVQALGGVEKSNGAISPEVHAPLINGKSSFCMSPEQNIGDLHSYRINHP